MTTNNPMIINYNGENYVNARDLLRSAEAAVEMVGLLQEITPDNPKVSALKDFSEALVEDHTSHVQAETEVVVQGV